MGDARMAVGFDRLPWLEDEPEPRAKHGLRGLIALAVAGVTVIAGASYWIGRTTGDEPVISRPARPSTTLALPEARPAQPEVKFDRVPEVEPEVVPKVDPAPQGQVSVERPVARPGPKRARAKPSPRRAARAAAPAARTQSTGLTLWPAARSGGAAGRMVQIGAFGTRYQAKRGWWAMVRAYPALQRLPTVVTEARNSRGKRFYRLQIGTTSQAHSEVLCQRMQKIRYSCAVVGLPGRPKGVER